MILPTKGISSSRALLTVGAQLLSLLVGPLTVSGLWHSVKSYRVAQELPEISFDWFVLGLDLLFLLGTVELQEGLIVRRVDR
ncbi:MAG: ABC-three component system middle component 6 [Candidatus Dormibacteria bacterium]